jgi:spore germination protein
MINLRRWNLGLLFALLLYQTTAMAGPLKTWAYSVWWLPDGWRNAPLRDIDRLFFFELKVNSNGEIAERNGWPEKWVDLRLAVKQKNTPLDLTLTLFDPATFTSLFTSTEATQRLLEEAVSLARQDGVAGLQLDFEIYTAIAPETLTRYRSFVRELSNRLRRQSPSRNLSIFFPIGGESALYDATTLKLVNHVVLQGYDAHWKGSKTAGPLSPLNGNEVATWKKAVAQGVALGVPKARMLLSFPLYGYEWEVKGQTPRSETIGSGITTSFALLPDGLLPDIQFNIIERVKKYGATHDPVSGSSYYQFKRKNGELVEGWFEDVRSLKRKSDYLEDEKLGGLAFFPLGYDGGQLIDSFMRRRDLSNRQDTNGSR